MVPIPDWIIQPLNKIRIFHFRQFYVQFCVQRRRSQVRNRITNSIHSWEKVAQKRMKTKRTECLPERILLYILILGMQMLNISNTQATIRLPTKNISNSCLWFEISKKKKYKRNKIQRKLFVNWYQWIKHFP